MVTKNLKSKLQHLISALSMSSLVLAGVAAVPAPVAYAAPVQQEQARDERLEQVYRREQQWLSTQQDNLTKMNSAADKVQQFIAVQQGKGKDVSALQAALATFRSQIATAQSAHTTAANVLSTHLGFDANGKVTNAAEARQTVTEARQALRGARNVMRQAVLDLHRAIRAWRQANGLKTIPPAATRSS